MVMALKKKITLLIALTNSPVDLHYLTSRALSTWLRGTESLGTVASRAFTQQLGLLPQALPSP